jgi:hypothetical protein
VCLHQCDMQFIPPSLIRRMFHCTPCGDQQQLSCKQLSTQGIMMACKMKFTTSSLLTEDMLLLCRCS